jgi:Alpha-amylase/alpha-mannosidase
MNDKKYVLIGFKLHQPYRIRNDFLEHRYKRINVKNYELGDYYFGFKSDYEIFKRVAEKCYIPSSRIILESIEKYKREIKRVKFFFSFSGILIEQAKNWCEELLDIFKDLLRTGCVEFLCQTYFHSLASLWKDKSEWIEQILMHKKLIKELFNYEPKVFENTELIYNNTIAWYAEKLGFKGIITEGCEKILGWRKPTYVYKAKYCENIRVLLRHYRLSDDIAFRFSMKNWDQWPLTAEKFARWVKSCEGNCILIFVDYETFGEHHWKESGILDFLKYLTEEIVKYEELYLSIPSEVIENLQPVGEIDVNDSETISWADEEKDISAWYKNSLQKAYVGLLEKITKYVKETNDENLIKIWRYLQVSDIPYYMSLKRGASEEVHEYFSVYKSPLHVATLALAIALDFEARVKCDLKVFGKDEFHFYYNNNYSGFSCISLKGFIDILEKINVESIEHHLYRRDFEEWAKFSLENEEVEQIFINARNKNLKGNDLRNFLILSLKEYLKNKNIK